MAYVFYTSVVIQNGKVADDHSDFPILVSGTFDGTGGEADLRTTGNGGNIQNTDASGGVSGGYTVPADFVFSPNNDGSSEYDFEIEKYDATTGEIIAWVEIPTMDADADVTLYMCYGDSGVTTTQEDVNGTWNAGYKAVYHMAEASGNILDSVGNHDSTAVANTPDYQQAGQVGYSINFDDPNKTDTDAEGFEIDDHADFALDALTLEAWVNPDSEPVDGRVLYQYDGTTEDGFIFGQGAGVFYWSFTTFVGGTAKTCTSANAPSTSWEYIAATRAAAGAMVLYVDAGAEADTETNNGTINSTDPVYIGHDWTQNYGMSGYIDEVRISDVDRGANWITTTFNTIDDVSTFLVFGSEAAHATIIEVPLGTLTITGFVPTISPLNLDIPLGTLSITGLVPTFDPELNIEIPLGALTITGLAPLINDETLLVRTADGTTLLASIVGDAGVLLVSDGANWYALNLPEAT